MIVEVSVPWGLTEGMETSAALGEGTDMHGALVIPLLGCCGWRFPGGAVLPLAREGDTAQADEKTVGWKEILAMERRDGYNEEKGGWENGISDSKS